MIENAPIDYLDFASPESGLGGKMGFDATNKIPPETKREWGKKCSQLLHHASCILTGRHLPHSKYLSALGTRVQVTEKVEFDISQYVNSSFKNERIRG